MDNFEKENKRLKVLIVILLLVLLGFGGYYFYTTYIKGEDKTAIDNCNCETNYNEDNNTWNDYLANQKDIKITLTKVTSLTEQNSEIKKELTNDEIKEYLKEISSCEIKHIINGGGLGGPEMYSADISYTLDNQKINSKLSYGSLFIPDYNKDTVIDEYFVYLLSKSSKKEIYEKTDFVAHFQMFDFDGACATQAIENFF